jgi:hypothetical protein
LIPRQYETRYDVYHIFCIWMTKLEFEMASHNILEEFVWQKRHKVFPVTTYNFCCLLIIVTEKDQCITFYNYFCRRQSCSFTVENFISIYSRNHVKLTSDYLEFNLAKNERWIIVEKKLKFEDNSHLHGYSSKFEVEIQSNNVIRSSFQTTTNAIELKF